MHGGKTWHVSSLAVLHLRHLGDKEHLKVILAADSLHLFFFPMKKKIKKRYSYHLLHFYSMRHSSGVIALAFPMFGALELNTTQPEFQS